MRRAVVLVFALAALARGAPARAQDDNTAFAQQLYVRGLEQFAAHRYDDALDLFRRSMALRASPNTRLGLARCLRDLGRFGEAYAEYQHAAVDAGELAATAERYGRTADTAREEGAAVAARVGFLELVVPGLPPDATVRVSGREVPAVALAIAIPVTAGDVAVAIDATGFAPLRSHVLVTAGARVRAVQTLRSLPSVLGRGPPGAARFGPNPALPAARALFGVGLGVGAAGAIGAGVFWALASARHDALSNSCVDNLVLCSDAERNGIALGRGEVTATNVAWIAAAAGAALAVGGLIPMLALPGVRLRAVGAARHAAVVVEF